MKPNASLATRVFTAVVEIPAVIVIFVMMVHVTANALMRTYLDHPLKYTLEIVQYWYLPILALLGFVAAQARGQHIATDLVYARLPRPFQRIVLFVVFGVSAVIIAGCAWFGWGEAQEAQRLNLHAGVSTVPSWQVYYLVPVVFGILAVQLAFAAIRGLAGHGLEMEEVEPEDAIVLADLERDHAEEATR
ncbi:TRAP-type C4-dicarboxylate transport system permease small subunit [Nocardioides sp. J9]|uniref:TRAP transporter small permease n=1 Tax=unclassified Nocardioides TaxID=2615069 RepID=UPI0004ADDCC8|nr:MULTISPECIES: TRAP transporter small permease [unclassified Nocardioides]TWG94797.1 TRAP-type C4-dicarboxylate transport system permease small subunit [Nocardioides sp. J9]